MGIGVFGSQLKWNKIFEDIRVAVVNGGSGDQRLFGWQFHMGRGSMKIFEWQLQMGKGGFGDIVEAV